MTKINLNGVIGWDIDHIEFSELLDSTSGDVAFEMGSGGGFITPGITIMNMIKSYDRGTTTARISHASSMMTQIALACDKVEVYDNAIFMIHNAQNIEAGDHNDMRAMADHLEQMSNMLALLYVKKSGKSLDEIKTLMDETTYFFGREIVDAGFADEVIDTDGDNTKDTAMVLSKELTMNATKAMKQEKLTVADMEKNISMCQGNCNVGDKTVAMPVKKLANSNQGTEMTKEQIAEMQEQNKAYAANKVTMDARAVTAQLNIETLEAKVANFDAVKASLELKTAEANATAEAEKTATAEMVNARIVQAFDGNVASVETITAMIGAKDDAEASTIKLNAKPQTDAINQGDGGESAGKWAGIGFNKK